MPTLPDPKREQFAQLCSRGIQTIDAYVRAGYKRNTGNATSLKKRPDVQARIEELQSEMAGNKQVELNEYLKDSGLSPTHIVKKLKETAEEALANGKYDVAAKCWKDLGGELFGMFVERKHVQVDKQSVHTETTTTINIEGLNQALKGLGDRSQKGIEIDGYATAVDFPADRIPILAIPGD